MSDRSFGDYANRNVVKNPLLSTAVTGLSIEDLTQNAVLLPAVPSQETSTRQGRKAMNNIRKPLDYREDEIIDNVEKFFEMEKNHASDLLRNLEYAKIQTTPDSPVQVSPQLFSRLKNFVYGMTKINERVMLATGVGKSSVSMARRETGSSKIKSLPAVEKNVGTEEDLSEKVGQDNVIKVYTSSGQNTENPQEKGAGKNVVIITKNVSSNQVRRNDETAKTSQRQDGGKKVVHITKNLKRARQNDDELTKNLHPGQGSSKQVVIITKNTPTKRIRRDSVEDVIVDEQNVATERVETRDEDVGSPNSGEEIYDEVYAIETEIIDDDFSNSIVGRCSGDVQNYDVSGRDEENAVVMPCPH